MPHRFNTNSSTMRLRLLLSALLLIATLAIYIQVLGYAFITYDTLVYVTDNTRVHAGITSDNIKWAFATSFFSNWHPLTWLSYMLDIEIWGLSPTGFHATNLILHLCNSLLLFFLLQRITATTWRSWLVAGLFALHPMHVESVAWIAERKDVLSAFFFLLTILCYIKYLERQTRLRYSSVLLSFLLALMSKAMVVSLPAILLLLDYWPLRRFDRRLIPEAQKTPPIHIEDTSKYSAILEKIPLFLLAAFDSWMTIIAQHSNLTTLESLPLTIRIANAFTAYLSYIEKTLWPANLAVFYPYPHQLPLVLTIASIFVLTTITILAITWRQSRPWFIAGWFWFLGALVPVIGLIQMGQQFIADRYTYLPHIGFFIIVSWGLHELLKQSGKWRWIYPVTVCLILCAAGIQTWKQLRYWEDDYTLWARALDVTENNHIAENNMGSILLDRGKSQGAKEHFLRAIEISPNYADGQSNIAMVLANEGKLDESIQHYLKAIELSPYAFLSHYRLALVLRKNDMPAETITYLQNAITLKPQFVDAYIQLGELYTATNQLYKALETYTKLIDITPNNPIVPLRIQELHQLIQQQETRQEQ